MSYQFSVSPAHTVLPGTVVEKDGVVFSAVFRNCTNCGLVLYHLPDLEEVRIPFTDEQRYGSLYSVLVRDLDPAKWGYRYYRDDVTFEDPYARELETVFIEEDDGIAAADKNETSEIVEEAGKPGKKKKELTLCRLFPQAEDSLPAYGQSRKPWSDTNIYLLHVKGFTASRSSGTRHGGTFDGVIEKIPYLQSLGITAVELMPVYELRPEMLGEVVGEPKDIASGRYNISVSGDAGIEKADKKVNYWNFGEGCYFAPKRAYSASGRPQEEFLSMVNALHKAGIDVYLQMFFPDTVSIQTQLEAARFYVTHYHIDGFHLKGNDAALKTLASDPMLSDTAVLYYDFPYDDLQKEDKENPYIGRPSIEHLGEYKDDYETLIRRFVKSDNGVLRSFVKAMVTVPKGHGSVHYFGDYEGFTLADLVSYNGKHNEANGEDNRDGRDNNYSWNCGVEGRSYKKEIRTLRIRQMKNFLSLNYLSQGTPLLNAGDERCNSQGGNNNPYCQDNETGWMNWKETVDGHTILDFTRQMIALRKAHPILRQSEPFRFNDYKLSGYPDISLHGAEAWKPDYSDYSHCVGILLNENYADEAPADSYLYIAVNMHWHSQRLAIPALPEGFKWHILMDTFEDSSFVSESERAAGKDLLEDPHHVSVRCRSIMVLQAVREKKDNAAQDDAGNRKNAVKKSTIHESENHITKDASAF